MFGLVAAACGVKNVGGGGKEDEAVCGGAEHEDHCQGEQTGGRHISWGGKINLNLVVQFEACFQVVRNQDTLINNLEIFKFKKKNLKSSSSVSDPPLSINPEKNLPPG